VRQQPQVTLQVAPQGTVQAKAPSGMDRLINDLEVADARLSGVTQEQAAAWRQVSDFDACHAAPRRLTEAKPYERRLTASPRLGGIR
jgi:hypothetical protein